MTIIYASNITVLEILPDSQWDVGLDKFIDWEPHSNGQLFITHVDPNPKTYPTPTPTYTPEPAYPTVFSGAERVQQEHFVLMICITKLNV